MPFLPQDLEQIQNATGLTDDEITSNGDLEAKYDTWLRMYHLMGGNGGLPNGHMICLLVMMGYTSPKPSTRPIALDWHTVKIGTRVIVSQPHGHFLCEYVGMIGGSICVRFNDDPMMHEFASRNITIAPESPPRGVHLSWVEPPIDEKKEEKSKKKAKARDKAVREEITERLQFEPGEEPELLPDPDDREVAIVAAKNLESKTEESSLVKVDAKWLMAAGGEEVLVEIDGKFKEGQFLHEGPGDGHLTVFIDDPVAYEKTGALNTMVVPEGSVVLKEQVA